MRDIIYRWDSIKPHTQINLDLFLEIVSFCMTSSYFVFSNQHYIQVTGTAMGNPLSPVLADLVMEVLLDTVTNKLNYTAVTIRKYVDDLFLIIPVESIERTLDCFNSYHSSIQFTYEKEVNGRLPYLDMTLVRQPDNTIRTEWYIKPIASGRTLNFFSIHPLSQKMTMVQNFISRVNRLSTNLNEQSKRDITTDYLKLNDYPLSIINRCLNRTNWNFSNNGTPALTTTPPSSTTTVPIVYRSIPFIHGLTQQIIHVLRASFPFVKISPRSTHNISRLYTTIKDPIPLLDHHGVIYRLECECKCSYIGMTGNLLKTRMSGHRSNVNALEKLLHAGYRENDSPVSDMKEKSTALIAHCIDHNHRFDLEGVKIIDQTRKMSSLPVLEMIQIYNDPNSINKRTDVDKLNSTYSGILHAIQKHTQRKIDRMKNIQTGNTNS